MCKTGVGKLTKDWKTHRIWDWKQNVWLISDRWGGIKSFIISIHFFFALNMRLSYDYELIRITQFHSMKLKGTQGCFMLLYELSQPKQNLPDESSISCLWFCEGNNLSGHLLYMEYIAPKELHKETSCSRWYRLTEHRHCKRCFALTYFSQSLLHFCRPYEKWIILSVQYFNGWFVRKFRKIMHHKHNE